MAESELSKVAPADPEYADPPDDALFVSAPLLAGRLDGRPEALVEDGIVEDQARSRIGLQERLYLLEEQSGGELLALEVPVYGVVAPLLEVIGHVGEGVVDLAAQQVLTVVQLRKSHAFRISNSHSA